MDFTIVIFNSLHKRVLKMMQLNVLRFNGNVQLRYMNITKCANICNISKLENKNK